MAQGDVTGDGVAEIIAGRASGIAEIKVFDGVTFQQIKSFKAFGPAYRGGVELGFGYFGSKTGDLVVGMASGGSSVKVFDGETFAAKQSFRAFGPGTRGVRVAVANLDNDPDAEIVTGAGRGGAPLVRGFDPANGEKLYEFAVGRPGDRSGVELTAGDFNGNNVTDLAASTDARGVSTVSVWTRGTNGPERVSQFQPFGQQVSRGIELGTMQSTRSGSDLIGVSANLARRARSGPSVVTAQAYKGLSLFDQQGQAAGTAATEGLGQNEVDLSSGANVAGQSVPIAPSDWVHAIDYAPTWPYWSISKPVITVTKLIDSKTIEFTYQPTTMPWTTDLFVGSHLYDLNTQYYFGQSTIKTITGNAANGGAVSPTNTLVITGPDQFQPSVVGHQIVIANDQLSDSDFFNSAFKPLWQTPRYQADGGTKLNDLQVMQRLGVASDSGSGSTVIRLYDWNGERGFSGPTTGTSEHLEFLNAAQQAGLKVIVPVSNFFLGDKDAWNGAAPDGQYDSTNGIPQAIRDALDYFIKSVSADGKGGGGLHPAIAGFSVGNEIELNSNAFAQGNMTKLAQRTLWWVVNIQSRLESLGWVNANNQNQIRFTSPVSNADDDSSNPAQKSWFQIFRHGAKSGDLMPSGPAAGTRFDADVPGLEALKGADWYKTWFYNSYQTSKTGEGLTDLLDRYNAPRGTGDWHNQWPGEAFPVPLVLTELDYSIAEAGSEGAYFNTFANDQVQVAENFLRGEAVLGGRTIDNQSFAGYALFEFNQEPHKTLNTSPDSEQTRGMLKYYQDRDVQHWRTPQAPISRPTTPLTTRPKGQTFAPFEYPVYPLYSITSDAGESLIDKIQGIVRAPRKK